MLDQDLEDMELLGVMDPSFHDAPTRDEALADALGVRRTPRKSVGKVGKLEPRTRHRNDAASVNRSGFMHNPSLCMKDTSFMETDTSFVETTQLLNLRPLSNLHPNVAMQCLFEEPSESAAALNVFLASNLEGSGLLVLGLVTLSSIREEQNSKILRLFSIQPSPLYNLSPGETPTPSGPLFESLRHRFSVKLLCTKYCIAAQPIQSTPVPHCFLPHLRNREHDKKYAATDILILNPGAGNQNCLSLHRAQCHVTDCALSKGEEEGNAVVSIVTDLRHPVHEKVDMSIGIEKTFFTRVKLSLELGSALAEKALLAIESSLLFKSVTDSNTSRVKFALNLRADCYRLDQALNQSHSVSKTQHLDTSWGAVSCLLNALVDRDLFNDSAVESFEKNAKNSESAKISSWELLLNSSFHANYATDRNDVFFLGGIENNATNAKATMDYGSVRIDQSEQLISALGTSTLKCLPPASVVADVFDTLHLVYEDSKLSSSSSKVEDMRCIGSFLVGTCLKSDRAGDAFFSRSFLDHYTKDLGAQLISSLGMQYLGKIPFAVSCPSTFDEPPCFLSWLDATIEGRRLEHCVYDAQNITNINAACVRTRSLLRLYGVLFDYEKTPLESEWEVVKIMCEEGLQKAGRVSDELSTGVALPLLEALNHRRDPEQSSVLKWTAAEFSLVGRQDLCLRSGKWLDDTPIKLKSTVPVRASDPDNPAFIDRDTDGIVPLQVSSSVFFPADNRIKEAGRLLRSSQPCFLSVPRAIEVTDHEYERIKQSKLILLCRRVLSLPVGRGMLTIGSFHPVAAEPLPVPDLCLVGRVPPSNTNLALDMSECQIEFRVWPEFHNGAAAGLRLPLEGEPNKPNSKITRTWIVYNRPTNNGHPHNQTNGQPPLPTRRNHAHGGLLLALGLRGHLAALEMTDIYDYLTHGQITLTCGVLLGMAANKRGSCDISVSKMLCLHLPSLIPQHFSAIDVASPVQTAAVTGAGLLFQGSSHRMITEFLLNEIGRRPESDITIDREAYTLSCGIALGMVNICKGESITDGQSTGGGDGLGDLRIPERLHRYIVGGTDSEEVHRTREANDRLNLPASSPSGEAERCSCVFEGDAINIDVTAAGATLALGLMFMHSGYVLIKLELQTDEHECFPR